MNGATVLQKCHNTNFNHFWLIHPRDRTADGQTD